MKAPDADRGPDLVRVAVVDDNTFYRDWLGASGALAEHHRVVARAASAQELAALLTRLDGRRCDVIILDLRIVSAPAPDDETPVHGRDSVSLLVAQAGRAVAAGLLMAVPAVLINTQERQPAVHLACLVEGAAGVVTKNEPLERLREAIDVVARGGLFVSASLAAYIEETARRGRLELTDAQLAVLALASHGLSRRQIGRRLGIGESTVDKHLGAVRDHFGHDANLPTVAGLYGLLDLAPPRPPGPTVGDKAQLVALDRRVQREGGDVG